MFRISGKHWDTWHISHSMHTENMDGLILCIHCAIVGILLALFTAVLPFSLYFHYFAFVNLILYFIFATSAFRVTKKLLCRTRIQPKNKAVLITGCGSGFGKALAKRLDSKGFQVFATCHYPEGEGVDDLKKNCSDRLKVFCLDVSKDESVKKAVSFVRSNLGSNDLWAVVNNAGISKAFTSFDISSLDNFKETMEVNVFGAIRVTKAFLPMLKKSKGRIVNINSIIGRTPFVEACAYAVSKHAGVGLTKCLSLEMKTWGIRVISIDPEAFRTGLSDIEKAFAAFRKEYSKVPNDVASYYEETYIKKLVNFGIKSLKLASKKVDIVIDDMESAVTLKNPCQVYTPCRNTFTRIFFQIAETLPFEIYKILAVMLARIWGYPSLKDV